MCMALIINAVPKFLKPQNSSFVSFAKGTQERTALVAELDMLRARGGGKEFLPLWIGGPVVTDNFSPCRIPHGPGRELAQYSNAYAHNVNHALRVVLHAQERWSQIPWYMRLFIFKRAARLLEKKYLIRMVAAVMEEYSKNPYEAFIDVQELIDFWNFGCYYAAEIYHEQPDSNQDTMNFIDYRPLEGFVLALPPNNFVAICGNLATNPLIMGNVVIAKPPSDVVYTFHLVLRVLLEAGLPHDVLAVLHGNEEMIGEICLDHPELAGVHFTGSTEVFEYIAKRVYGQLEKYRNNPRIVGETGGKNAIIVYDDHDPVETASAMVIGGFGAQGRKCSATSRVYMTDEMWERVKPPLLDFMARIKVGETRSFENYMGSLPNREQFQKVRGYIDRAREAAKTGRCEILASSAEDYCANPEQEGYFISPIVIVTADPQCETMKEEIFGPVITVCKLPGENFPENAKTLCDRTSVYSLTGAVHTNNIHELCDALQDLRYTAGNIYNWKTTGAMVGAQPFSGSRKSGTNSKVGWKPNLLQWTSMRTISLTYDKPRDFAPPYLEK